MTVEEKAKAYDIIVQRVTELYETGTTLTKEQMEHLFPELRESEDDDERIRMRLTEVVLDIAGGWPFEKYGITKKEALAYLEKQKEQKPVDYDHEMWKNCEANFEGGKKEVIEHPERYGLQKPAEWSEEDEKMRYFVTEAVQSRYSDKELAKYLVPKIINEKKQLKQKLFDWLRDLRPHWKPSEKQIKALKDAKMRMSLEGWGICPLLQSLIDELESL